MQKEKEKEEAESKRIRDSFDRSARGEPSGAVHTCRVPFSLTPVVHTCRRIYGFHDECKRRYNVRVWRQFNDVFDCLPFR
jgi:hypothetical protein